MDAVDELVTYAQPNGLNRTISRVHRFHKANPQVLDFLIQELRDVRASGWTRASLGSLWHHARWVLTQKYCLPGESFAMSNNLFPHYGRIIVILFPEFNGFYKMVMCQADKDFSTALESEVEPGRVRRLLWADGREIGRGWRPSKPHEPKPVSRRAPVRRVQPESVGADAATVRVKQ